MALIQAMRPASRHNSGGPATVPNDGEYAYSRRPVAVAERDRNAGSLSSLSPITSCRQLLILQGASRCRTANSVGERLANRAGARGAGLWAGGVSLG